MFIIKEERVDDWLLCISPSYWSLNWVCVCVQGEEEIIIKIITSLYDTAELLLLIALFQLLLLNLIGLLGSSTRD